MRIPLDKVYRAFPELDPFTDAQCRAYVRLAVSERWRSRLLRIGASVVVGFLAFPAAGLMTGVWAFVLRALVGRVRGEDPMFLAFTLGLLTGMLPMWVGILIMRDVWLRWAVRQHLRGAACPTCGYSMLGLAVKDGNVTCPECGGVHNLKAMGRSEEDIMANVLANVACSKCRYTLTGLMPAGGLIQCPECGAKQAIESLHRAGAAPVTPS